jgi:D-ribulokinase
MNRPHGSLHPESFLLAIDVGTLSARAGLFRPDGEFLAARSAAFDLLQPAEHHAVYRMDEIWAAVCSAVRAVVAAVPGAAAGVAGLAIDAASSMVLVAEGDPPLEERCDVICWMDHRAEAEAKLIDATADRYLGFVGGTVSPEMFLPKLLWMKRHRPADWRRVRAVRALSDEIAFRATGIDLASVCSLACKFPYLPGDAEPWRHPLLDQLGMSDLLERGTLAGQPGRVGHRHGSLSPVAAHGFGLSPGVPVAVGLIDAEAGALGVLGRDFAPKMNRILALIGGTSTCYMSWAEDMRPISGIWGPFKDAVFPGFWMHEAGQSFSGAALDAVLDHHPASPGRASAEHHTATIAEIMTLLDQEGPSFAAKRHLVPDWLGNRAPLGDGNARAIMTGIGVDSGRRAFLEEYYATARALALQSRHIIEHLNAHGYAIDRVSLSGGHTRNPLLVRLYRDALGAGLVTTKTDEPVLLGTAMVAAVGAGLQPDLFAALDAMSAPQRAHAADPRWARAHDAAYATYLKLFAIRNEIEAQSTSLAAEPSAAGVY